MSSVPEIEPVVRTSVDPSSTTKSTQTQTTQNQEITNNENPSTNQASVPNNGVDEKPIQSKKTSRWAFPRALLALKLPKQEPKSSTSPKNEKQALMSLITADIHYVKQVSDKLNKYEGRMMRQIEEAEKKFEGLKDEGTVEELKEFKKGIAKLKLLIPSKYKVDADDKDPNRNQKLFGFSGTKKTQEVLGKMPLLHGSNLFKDSPEYIDFEERFNKLDTELKLCLLCFSVFPENEIIKKRLMVYWWVAEGFVPLTRRDEDTGKTPEEFASEFFQKLIKLGFIEPVTENRSRSVGCCKVQPFVRSALARIAEKARFFNFDVKGDPTQKFMGSLRACLVGKGLIDYQDLQSGDVNAQDLEKLHLVFNINESILEFEVEWFLNMKNVNVLYLGRWKASATEHIEVEETKFLDGLKVMDHLRWFSLQGVSRVMELPDSILHLPSLVILDLRACHNLESIPENIGMLRNLIHLDISECYMLDHMPKSLASLMELRVLKGFVVGREGKNSCTIDDLEKLTKLIKLSIYTGLREFPTDKHIASLERLQVLRKLTIAWGGGAIQTKPSHNSQTPKQENGGDKKKESTVKEVATGVALKQIPLQLEKLEKLDLKCYPVATTSSWLAPSGLSGLKKLYIRGGKFSDLGQYQDLDHWDVFMTPKYQWKVETLRLKYLSELEMDWGELQEIFPDLTYLEKVNCPKLTLFPCDGTGVWINKEKIQQLQGNA